MKNIEKYRDEIVTWGKALTSNDFCRSVASPLVLKSYGYTCQSVSCSYCHMLQMIWLEEEYQEPETDWSQVAVDTPILVRDSEDKLWERRYFARYSNYKVWAWCDGLTSWSVKDKTYMSSWNYAKLAEGSRNEQKKADQG